MKRLKLDCYTWLRCISYSYNPNSIVFKDIKVIRLLICMIEVLVQIRVIKFSSLKRKRSAVVKCTDIPDVCIDLPDATPIGNGRITRATRSHYNAINTQRGSQSC